MKKIALAVCSFLAIACHAAIAQTPATPSAIATSAAIDPAAAAAARDLLESMNYRDLMRTSFAQALANMPTMMKQSADAAITANSTLTVAQKKQAMAKVDAELPGAVEAIRSMFEDPQLIEEMTAEIVPLYARHFTVQEIRQIADFYKTPIGTKMLATMPQIMGESMQISQRLIMPRIGKMIEKLAQVK